MLSVSAEWELGARFEILVPATSCLVPVLPIRQYGAVKTPSTHPLRTTFTTSTKFTKFESCTAHPPWTYDKHSQTYQSSVSDPLQINRATGTLHLVWNEIQKQILPTNVPLLQKAVGWRVLHVFLRKVGALPTSDTLSLAARLSLSLLATLLPC
ncbi:hypothetical protein J6590_034406 [Homalodisca vitripennis]|nr:hypothetical protein J6590_034406 [Homalodisca vitripennis]